MLYFLARARVEVIPLYLFISSIALFKSLLDWSKFSIVLIQKDFSSRFDASKLIITGSVILPSLKSSPIFLSRAEVPT